MMTKLSACVGLLLILFFGMYKNTLYGQSPLQRMVVSELASKVPSVSLDYPGQAIVVIDPRSESFDLEGNQRLIKLL